MLSEINAFSKVIWAAWITTCSVVDTNAIYASEPAGRISQSSSSRCLYALYMSQKSESLLLSSQSEDDELLLELLEHRELLLELLRLEHSELELELLELELLGLAIRRRLASLAFCLDIYLQNTTKINDLFYLTKDPQFRNYLCFIQSEMAVLTIF